MATKKESWELDGLDPESLIREYREKIQQAIENEGNLLREKAERESEEIIARAKETAEKTIIFARQKASIESEQIIAKAKEEAGQITRESREQSARAINEIRKKLVRIVKEVTESGALQTQNEISRATSEARTKTSRLLSQVSQRVEQIIDETETRTKAEFERLSAVIAEVETELSSLEEFQVKQVDAKPQSAIREAVTLITPPPKKTEPPVPSFKENLDTQDKEPEESRLFEGSLTLEIVSPFDQAHQGDLPEILNRIRGLKVKSKGSYNRADRRISKYSVDLGEPVPLLKILNGMPQVKDVSEHKEKIEVTLK